MILKENRCKIESRRIIKTKNRNSKYLQNKFQEQLGLSLFILVRCFSKQENFKFHVKFNKIHFGKLQKATRSAVIQSVFDGLVGNITLSTP